MYTARDHHDMTSDFPIDASHPEQAMFRWRTPSIAEKDDNNRPDRRGFGAGNVFRITRLGNI
jgi:hypothetical protein